MTYLFYLLLFPHSNYGKITSICPMVKILTTCNVRWIGGLKT